METIYKKVAVYTKDSRIIGYTDRNPIQSIKSGIKVEGRTYVKKGRLLFLGKPLGDYVYVKELFSEGQNRTELPLDRAYESYNIPQESILFIHDFEDIGQQGKVSLERNLLEKRAFLADVSVKFPEFGSHIKGKTYLNKEAYDNGVVLLESRHDDWFVLQQPQFSEGNGKAIYDRFGIEQLEKENFFELNVLLINKTKVFIAKI